MEGRRKKIASFLTLSLSLPLSLSLSLPRTRKRPLLEEVQNHRWLNAVDYMAKKRQRATFPTNRIQVSGFFFLFFFFRAAESCVDVTREG